MEYLFAIRMSKLDTAWSKVPYNHIYTKLNLELKLSLSTKIIES